MNSWIIAHRLIKEIGSDKRTVAMVFIAPILIISLLYVVLNTTLETIHLGMDTSFPVQLESEILKVTYLEPSEMKNALDKGTIDGYIEVVDTNYQLTIQGVEPTIENKIISEIQKTMKTQLNEKLSKFNAEIRIPELKINFLIGDEDGQAFDHIAPFMMGYVVFFLIFLLSGIAFLRERISGTMTRMLSTAVKRGEIVGGYIIGFGVFAIGQTIIIQIYMIEVLKIPNHGNFIYILITNLLIAGGSLTLGILLSAFARNEFQLFQFIPVVIIPQTLFAGLFSLRDAHPIILFLSQLFPLKYAADALNKIMVRGKGIEAFWMDWMILLGFMILFLTLNINVLKKYRNT